MSRITDSEFELFWLISASSCRGSPIPKSNCVGRLRRPHFEDHRFRSRIVLVDFGVLISRITDSEFELFWLASASSSRGSPSPKSNCFGRFLGVLVSRITDSKVELFWSTSASSFRGSPIPKSNCVGRIRRPHFEDHRVQSRIVLVDFRCPHSEDHRFRSRLCWSIFGVLISGITDSEVELF